MKKKKEEKITWWYLASAAWGSTPLDNLFFERAGPPFQRWDIKWPWATMMIPLKIMDTGRTYRLAKLFVSAPDKVPLSRVSARNCQSSLSMALFSSALFSHEPLWRSIWSSRWNSSSFFSCTSVSRLAGSMLLWNLASAAGFGQGKRCWKYKEHRELHYEKETK